ncbi:BBSome complex assembly protein BBS10-like [Ciona intestinalis]
MAHHCKLVNVSDVTTALQPYVTMMSQLLGPEAGKVLITKQNGEVTITSDGWTLINFLISTNPVARIVTKACSVHTKAYGGGCKSFMLMVNAGLEYLSGSTELECHVPSNRIKVISALNWFQAAVLGSDRFERELANMTAISTKLNNENYKVVETVISDIVRTCFAGKFSNSATVVLSDLTTKLLWKICDNVVSNLRKTISNLLQNLDDFVVEAPGQLLIQSTLVEGILIDRDIRNFIQSTNVQNILVLNFDDSLTPGSEFSVDLHWNNFSSFLEFPVKLIKNWIKTVKNKGVTVFFCQGKMLGTFHNICENNGVQVVDCLTAEQVNFLCKSLEISAVNDITDEISQKDIAAVKISEFFISRRTYVKVTPLKSSKQQLYTVVVGSPSPGLCSQYKAAIHNALTVVSHWLNHSPLKSSLCYSVMGGGVFFLLLYRLINDTPWVRNVCGNLSNIEEEKLAISCKILSEVLLVIPRTLHKNSFLSKEKSFRFITLLSLFENLKIDQLQSSIYQIHIGNSYFTKYTPQWLTEPFTINLALVSNVLNVLIETLRVEQIVSVSSSLKQANRQIEDVKQ